MDFPSTCHEFLRELRYPSGHINLFELPSKVTTTFAADDLARLEQYVDTVAQSRQVYFEVGLQSQPPASGQRGRKDAVSAIPGLWFDLDVRGPGHKADHLPTDEQALAFLGALPVQPTAVVSTGGGYHLYWLFDQPWVFNSKDEREKAATLSTRWQRHIISLGRPHGWKLDATHDLCRLLRLPGSWNLKINGTPRQVTVQSWSGRRFSIEQLSAALPSTEQPSASTKAQKKPKKSSIPSVSEELRHCGWVDGCIENSATLPEPAWYALLTLLARCDDGRDATHRWSAIYPGYSPTETDRKFDHALNSPGPATCQRIQSELGGEDACRNCPFAGKIKSPITLTNPTFMLSTEWAYVASVGMFYNFKTRQQLPKEIFNDLKSIILKNGTASRELLNSTHLIRADDFAFLPGRPAIIQTGQAALVNLWVDDGCSATDGDPSPLLEHIAYLIPDEAQRRHLIQWMAYAIQNPGCRPGHGVLLIGKQGTGKSFLGQWLRKIHGPANCAEVSTEELHSPYIDWLEGKSLIVIEELMASGRVELGNKLKPIFTASTHRINVKYQRPREIKITACFFATSNFPHAIHLEAGDRRWFVIHSPAEPMEPAYYGRLANLDVGALRRYLETVDLTAFNPAAPPPMTVAKAEMIEDSRTPLEWTIRHMLTEGGYPFDSDVVTLESVLQAARQDAPRATAQAVLAALKGLGAVKLPRVRLGHGIQVSPWAIRRQELWLQATPEAVREALQGQRRAA